MNLKLFAVHGPFDILPAQGKYHSYIPTNCPGFWKNHSEYRNAKGCYVFGFRASKGFRPVYVGKTKESFGAEAFTSHKIAQHYAPALADTGRGTPVMFFVTAPTGKGAPPKAMIRDLETFLIQVGVAKNPDLSNIQNRQEARWGIKGVVRGGKGKTASSAKDFKRMMGI